MSAEEGREADAKRVAGKMAWAQRKKATLGQVEPLDPERDRLPPGQHWTERWPVLDLGDQPEIARADWRLTIDGAVEAPLELDFEALSQMRQHEIRRDFHCVTTWSTQDNLWQGVRFADLMDRVQPRETATHVMLEGYDRAPDSGEFYTTNLALSDCLEDEVMLIHARAGVPLDRVHGGPVRMMVPKLYAWKSAKWLKRITLMESDRSGYWELRGYSDTARPWEDDRFQ